MKTRITLRARMVLLVMAAILPLLGLSVAKAVLVTDASISRATGNLQTAASLVAANQQQLADTARQVLTAIANVPDIRDGNAARCSPYLAELKRQLPGYANLGIIGTDGYPRCHGLDGGRSTYLGDRAYFRDALARRGFVAGEYAFGRLSGKPTLSFALPVVNEAGLITQVAYVALDLLEMARAVAEIQLPPGARVAVIDRNGAVLAAKPEVSGGIGQKLPSPVVLEALKTMRSGVAEGLDAGGLQRIFAFQPSGKTPDSPFFVVLSIEKEQVVAPAHRQLNLELMVLALVAFLGGWLAWMMAGRSIVQPTEEILKATRLVQKGQMDVRVPLLQVGPSREFTRIADGFNLMADSLQQRERDLETELARSHQAYATLDMTVNSMREGLLAIDTAGRVLLMNEAASRMFLMDEAPQVLSSDWPRHQGLFVPGTDSLYPPEDLPLYRALQGETGSMQHMLVRNAAAPQGRLISSSFRPMRGSAGVIGALMVFSDITQLQQLQLGQAKSYNELRETQRTLIDAQRLGRIGNWELNLATRKIWWSDECAELFGLTPGGFDGSLEALAQMVHPDDRVNYTQRRDAAIADGSPLEIEYRIVTPAGEVRWINQRGKLLVDSRGTPVCRTGVVQDITERKQTELALADSVDLLRRTGAMAMIGGWEVILDGMRLVWSEQVYRIHDLDDARPITLAEGVGFYAPSAQPVMHAAVQAAIEHGTPWDLELPMVTALGRQIWVRTQGQWLAHGGKVTRLIGTLQDITEKRHSLEHLRLLETSISRLNDIVLITEAEPFGEPGPRIVFVNDAFERRTGYRRQEVLGKSPRFLQGRNTQRAELDRIGAALKSGLPVRSELINYTKSGEEFWTELDIAPVADANGWFTHWVAVSRDITQRKHAEQALIDSEQRYTALFEGAPLPMWVFDTATRQLLKANEATEKSYGYSARELLAMTLFDLHPQADHERLRQRLTGTELRKANWQHRRKDGSLFTVNVVSKPIQYAGRAARFVVALDVTAQLKAEQDVQDHLFTLQRAADAAQAITWHQTRDGTLHEIASQARGVIEVHQAVVSLALEGDWSQAIHVLSLSEKYASSSALIEPGNHSGVHAQACANNRVIRLTQAELEAHPLWRAIGQAAGQPRPMRGWLAVPLTGRSGKNIGLLQLSDKYEGEFTRQDEYVAMELAHLAAIAIENAGLLDEISLLNSGLEQKVAERTEALARQEALFRALAEQAPQVVWTANPQGSITYLNRTWFDLAGGELKDWAGTQWFSAVHPEDLADSKAIWKAAQANQSQYSGIRRLKDKDGSYHTMAYRASPVLDEQGQVVFWVGIDADITDFKNIETALRLSNQELEAFSYSVSHDLRSPLNTIDGFSRLLAKQMGREADEKVQHYLSRIQVGVAQMGQLIEGLLLLAQVSRAQLLNEPVDLSALAQAILQERQTSQPQRQAALHIESGLQAHGDGRLVRVVMENLLGNAWKFSSQQARTEIRVGQQADAAGLPVFFVSDNGAGFDMAYADKLFNPFQRLHAATEFPGTGVGLATVSRVVRRHGGRLWAESAPGRGATFFFTLPRAPGVL
ncbi:PAS domain S-box protein [Polaromonas sp.]|uniref:PAS domain S-box protein n=1 Tax=Polaromonas sp. TaxID=1869339 RepID=UPI002869F263|nr:PAS domain S-box protein [Polaromonas sp.]